MDIELWEVEMWLLGEKSFLNGHVSRWKMFQGKWVTQEKIDILKGVFGKKGGVWTENGACKDDRCPEGIF